jgi:hypothetical protein
LGLGLNLILIKVLCIMGSSNGHWGGGVSCLAQKEITLFCITNPKYF